MDDTFGTGPEGATAARPEWPALKWILVLAFALRAGVALFNDAILQPDEIYQ
jgi:hypothetical protein